jgi:magnesium transporter
MSVNRNRKITNLLQEIDDLVDRRKYPQTEIKDLLSNQSDQNVALLLDSDPEHRRLVFNALSLEQKIAALDLVNSHTLRSLVSHRSDSELIKLIESAPSIVSQKIASVTERSRINQIVPKLSSDTLRENLHASVNYPQRSVGRIMQHELLVVKDSWRVEQAVDEVTRFSPSNGPVYQVYVVDEDDHFKGTLPLSEMMRMGANKKIDGQYLRKPPQISPVMSQNRAAQLFREYDLIEAPVVQNGLLKGRILVDDILDVVHQEFTEDVVKFAGITTEETLETPVLESSRGRLPWMVGNIFLDLIAVSIILPFTDTIAAVTALAVLMPIVSDMGGNVGIQSLTVSIRSLADNKPQWRLIARELSKEIRLGIFNGLILGAIIGVIAFVGWGNPFLGLIVAIALLFNTLLASVIGGVIPIIMRKFKKDPAMMSGAVLTTITDFFGFLVFLGLARLFIEQLI